MSEVANSNNTNCPRCQEPLQRRLADFECAACGYFAPGGARGAVQPSRGPSLAGAVDLAEGPGLISGPLSRQDVVAGPDAVLSSYKLWYLVGAGLLFTAGNIAVLYDAFAGKFPALWLGGVIGGSLLTVFFIAVALYVDWPLAKLGGALAAFGFIALDAWYCYQGWSQFSELAKGKHIVDTVLLLVLSWLLLYEWRRENAPPGF
jgi:hypothetical protein